MRELIENQIRANWLKHKEEMTNVAYSMGWDYGYNDHNSLTVNGLILTVGVVDENLNQIIRGCSDDALLHWLESQHCQIYR